MVDSQIADLFGPYLRTGERVVWTGAPQRGLLFTSRDLFLVPFSVAWLGFVVFWETSVFRTNAPIFFRLWGAMFLIVGLFYFAGRFFLDAWVRRRTVYGLSRDRALTLRWVRGARFLSAPLSGSSVRLKQGPGGRGTLEFGGPSDGADGGFGGLARNQDMSTWAPGLSSRVQFLGIDNVMEAYGLAMKASES